MPRIVTKAFNEAILLHLLSLYALVLVNTLAEFDASIGMPGLRLGLSSLALGIRPAFNYLFQVFQFERTSNKIVRAYPIRKLPSQP